jgi:hypothetical protein
VTSAWARRRDRHGDAKRQAFLLQHGFRHDGESASFLYLRLIAEAPPAATVPGFEIRALAGPGEAATRAAAQREVWNLRPLGAIDGGDHVRLAAWPDYRPDLDVVAVDSSVYVAAFATGWADAVTASATSGPSASVPTFGVVDWPGRDGRVSAAHGDTCDQDGRALDWRS